MTKYCFGLILILFLTSSCASQDTLDLTSTLEVKKTMPSSTLMAAQNQTLPADPLLQKSLSGSFNPEELVFLVLTEHFVRLEDRDLASLKETIDVGKIIPGLTTVWRSYDKHMEIWAGISPLDQKKLQSLTHGELLTEINRVGTSFHDYYFKEHNSTSSYEIISESHPYILRVKSYYREKQNWKSEERYIFFYRPDFRLNLLIFGSDEDFQTLRPYINQRISHFKDKLREKYPANFIKES